MMPNIVTEAASILLSDLSGHDKLRLRNTKKEDLILYHMTWGQEIRNRFGLWAGNEALSKNAGVDHPDSASMKIIEAVWEEIRKE